MSDDIELGIDGLTEFKRIGSGGFSTVYVAWEADFSRWVAVKVLQHLDEAAQRRFSRERSLMGRSSGHPNVITPIRSGLTTDGKLYLVMQYMEGGSLQDIVDRGEVLPWRQAITLLRPIAEALGDSHRNGVVHKDVKPANILLARNGTPSLTDFGISGIRGTTSTQTAYTFAHTGPETFAAGVDIRDERSDLYSLASTLYTIVAGRTPFSGEATDSQLAWMHRIANHPVPSLGVDAQLDQFLAWAMAKDPAHRPQSAQEFIGGLDRLLAATDPSLISGETVVESPYVASEEIRDASRPVPATVTSSRAPRRRWVDMAGWTAAVAAVMLLAGAGWFAFLRDSPAETVTPGGGSSSVNASTDTLTEVTPSSDASQSSDGTDTGTDTDSAAPSEVQAAITLLQNPNSDVRTLVEGSSFLPGTSIDDGGFTFRSCESQLVGLQAAFGGPGLDQLRDDIAQWPSGSPSGYTDPGQSGRGYRERLHAYVDQIETGYRRCLESADIRPVGTHVLSSWASIQSFFCVTGTVAEVQLPGGTSQPCPAPGELELCVQILQPQLDTFFQAFPDRKPDGSKACEAAIENDAAKFEAL